MPWPNFMIAGAHKSGTSTLHEWLKYTPGFYMTDDKSPHYFSITLIPDDFIWPPVRNEKEYLKLFDGVTDEVAIGESTAHYLQDPIAPKLIHEKIPDCKFIISLRDPVERAYSHYNMYRTRDIETESFREAIERYPKGTMKPGLDYVGGGMYDGQIQRYWETFGKENVCIVIFEEWIKNQRETIKELIQFLGHDVEPPTGLKPQGYNKYGKPKGPLLQYLLSKKIVYKAGRKFLSPAVRSNLLHNHFMQNAEKVPMLDNDRVFLQDILRDNVISLSKTLERKLPWKNFPEVK